MFKKNFTAGLCPLQQVFRIETQSVIVLLAENSAENGAENSEETAQCFQLG